MSHRRPDPRQASLERTLRNALRLAADSVEPAADGLDRIRAKIGARQALPLVPRWRTAVPVVILCSLLQRLEPAAIWVRYAVGVIVDRFRPDPARAGRLGWLRPAAAIATGVFVVTAASWAIAALPQVVQNVTDTKSSHHDGGPSAVSSSPMPSRSGGTNPGGYPVGPYPSGSAHPSRSCKAASPSPGSSTKPSHSPSSSPSASPSSSASPSPSPSGTGTGSASPSPSESPTTSAATTSPGTQSASQAAAPGSPRSAITSGRSGQSSGAAVSPVQPHATGC